MILSCFSENEKFRGEKFTGKCGLQQKLFTVRDVEKFIEEAMWWIADTTRRNQNSLWEISLELIPVAVLGLNHLHGVMKKVMDANQLSTILKMKQAR